eukprot:Skav229703  [mRNA]  locus=scaffold49:55316:56164:+ [translate_table: standard]
MICPAKRQRIQRLVATCIFLWPRALVELPWPSGCRLGVTACRAELGAGTRSSLEKLEVLARDPKIRRVVLVFRHGQKEIVEDTSLPDAIFWRLQQEAGLTQEGRLQGQELGKQLRSLDAQVKWLQLLSSEAPRCIDTMSAVAGSDLGVKPEGAWMNATHKPGEEKEAAAEMRSRGWTSVMDRLSLGERIPGYLSLDEAVEKLRNTWIASVESLPETGAGLKPLELILVCTHDVILYALASWFSESVAPKKPDFLESALWWEEGGQDHFYYDSKEFSKSWPLS